MTDQPSKEMVARLIVQKRVEKSGCQAVPCEWGSASCACQLWALQDAEIAIAALQARPAAASPELINALRNQQQADEDGVLVLVSRQACDEAADLLSRPAAEHVPDVTKCLSEQPWLKWQKTTAWPAADREEQIKIIDRWAADAFKRGHASSWHYGELIDALALSAPAANRAEIVEADINRAIGEMKESDKYKFTRWEGGWRTYYSGFDLTEFSMRLLRSLSPEAGKFCPDGRQCFGFCESDGHCPAGKKEEGK